jgi:hypothetical protein
MSKSPFKLVSSQDQVAYREASKAKAATIANGLLNSETDDEFKKHLLEFDRVYNMTERKLHVV